MRRFVAIVVGAGVIAGAAACSDSSNPSARRSEDGEGSSVTSGTTPDPSPGTSVATPPVETTLITASPSSSATPTTTTPTTSPPTSTPPSPPPKPPEDPGFVAEGAAVRGLVSELRQFTGSQVLAPDGGRGYLLIGNEQQPGDVTRPRVWDSSDGSAWNDSSAPSVRRDVSAFLAGGSWFDGGLAVGGTVQQAGSSTVGAVWIAADGRAFGEQETPFGTGNSGVQALAGDQQRLVAAGYVDEGSATKAAVAIRAPSGRWRLADVPTVAEFAASGVVVRGSTVVVTGTDYNRDPAQAAALVSNDRGSTFRLADTSIYRGGIASAMGPVGYAQGQFVAVACGPTPDGQVTTIARSADGVTWTRHNIFVRGDDLADLSLEGGGCSSLSADGEVLKVGVSSLGGWVLTVARDGTAEAVLLPRRTGQVSEEPPLIATGARTVAIARDSGGFSPSRDNVLGSGLPSAAPSMFDGELARVGDGVALGVSLFPEVLELPDGRWQRQSFGQWFVADGRPFDAAPSGTIPAVLQQIYSTPFGAVGLGDADDPLDDDLGGPNRGTVAYYRARGGTWKTAGLVASGPGGDTLDAATSAGDTLVAVGEASLRDASGAYRTKPIVRSTRNGGDWATEVVPLAPRSEAGLYAACSLGSGDVVAAGYRIDDGVQTRFIARRTPRGEWSVVPGTGIPERAGIYGCATSGDRLVLYGNSSVGPRAWVSTDLRSFRPADLENNTIVDASLTQMVGVNGTFYAIGSRSAEGGSDAGVWRSEDGLTWDQMRIRGLGGPGVQQAFSVLAGRSQLTIAGVDQLAPVVWRVAL